MITFSYLSPVVFPCDVHHKTWLKAVIRAEGLQPGDIQYVFCNDQDLLQRNIQFLNHDTLTDIITFDNRVGECVSGEIFISVDRVQENAESLHVPIEDERLRVMVHGVLHLCGYKDKLPEEAVVMRQKENQYIDLFHQSFGA
jgi:rRNA maturation RNase YbeY